MNNLNLLLVPWTIEKTAKNIAKAEVLDSSCIVRTGVKTTSEALEAAVSEVLVNHNTLLDKLLKVIHDGAKEAVTKHRIPKENFDNFRKRVFVEVNEEPICNGSRYIKNLVSEVFGRTKEISTSNMLLLLTYFYVALEKHHTGKQPKQYKMPGDGLLSNLHDPFLYQKLQQEISSETIK